MSELTRWYIIISKLKFLHICRTIFNKKHTAHTLYITILIRRIYPQFSSLIKESFLVAFSTHTHSTHTHTHTHTHIMYICIVKRSLESNSMKTKEEYTKNTTVIKAHEQRQQNLDIMVKKNYILYMAS